ncbi:hypothetical protein CMT41_03120 [Colwellia sp. MT41]|uniref:Lipoprotein n=1 Tax=Colwellia marinimaniae TaxID=1513592 RepID=A0ABQ0MXS8_9GAMM|nr:MULTISPECIES: hypothetical protein [Colwellia]ALO33824.1 hypothetical protein CMT41_03120 [Colwellia sp. MT41]GAW97150.1 hypothetical protein MTCD1_02776 [Colwellia marinimaniae]
MTLSQYKWVLFLLILVPLLYACGDEEEQEVAKIQAAPPENTMQNNIAEQNKIEQEATNSLSSITIAGNFAFASQRMVSIDLHFSTMQFQEKISIYSTIDTSALTPVNLLEQGTINQSNSYKSMLTVATAINALIVVRNDDFSTLVTVKINNHDLLTHTFQE